MPAASADQIRDVLCVLLPVAMLVTYFRLFERYRRGKLWWDDFWALMCTVWAIAFIIVTLLHLQDPAGIKQNEKIIVFYLTGVFFYLLVWSVRLSILFTIVRLSFGRLRRILFVLGWLFGLTSFILIAQIFWVCENEPGWKDVTIRAPQCALGNNVAVAQLTTDVVSDLMLIAAPMYLFWNLQVQRKLKLRLRAVFATTFISTAVSLYHAYCVLKGGGLPEFLAATLQLSLSLFVANLSVVVAVLSRAKGDHSETDNVEPLSHVTISGSSRGRPKNPGLSTLATTDNTQKVNVHIVQTTDRWAELGMDDDGTHKFPHNDGPDRMEMKVLSP
ncbi:hypothetical protein B0H16DRAFT_1529755 [Mycena metata]|uniref:Rhodopsin domain-containing protein n=1 Tax=Mycena metata TaxID=1033252 RepID=A0AAD7IA03_9AGAR|nr:hypothetical protein B0H16DRAFT_1571926 [Mycena metata]KAJ7762127.1 hypothetical protein B0H16DRAFT_1529755 [Mycena metata]